MMQRRMPVLFVGHGSPMNAVQNNDFSRALSELGRKIKEICEPKAILSISAHWLEDGVFINTSPNPGTIHDFYGFPEKLYSIYYPAKGDPDTALKIIRKLSEKFEVFEDRSWGLDHGTWTVLIHMFPNADIPVFQMSINYRKPLSWHYDFAKHLGFLREEGVLIIASGNITHNLRMIFEPDAEPQPWTIHFDEEVKDAVLSWDHKKLVECRLKFFQIAHPEPSHYIPLIYAISIADEEDKVSFPYEGFQHGTLSMRAILFE